MASEGTSPTRAGLLIVRILVWLLALPVAACAIAAVVSLLTQLPTDQPFDAGALVVVVVVCGLITLVAVFAAYCVLATIRVLPSPLVWIVFGLSVVGAVATASLTILVVNLFAEADHTVGSGFEGFVAVFTIGSLIVTVPLVALAILTLVAQRILRRRAAGGR